MSVPPETEPSRMSNRISKCAVNRSSVKLGDVIQRKLGHKVEEKLTCFRCKYEKIAMKSLYTNFSNTLTIYIVKFVTSLARKYDLLIWESLWWYQGHIVQSVPAGNTEYRDSFYNALIFYSGDPPFEYRLGHFLFWLRFLVVFPHFFRQSQEENFEGSLPYIVPSFFTVCTVLQRSTYRAAGCGSVNYKVGT
jgi:hypothetical protein